MKKFTGAALFFALVMMFTGCNSAKPDISTNPAKIYYDHLVSKGKITTVAASAHGGGSVKYDVKDLYYFLGDFNYDGITDLAISTETSDSNGIEIYTYKDGQVTPLLSNHMPYSAGTEIFTLAKYEGAYGIKSFRKNSAGEFNFFKVNKDGTLTSIITGNSYDLEGNALAEAASYDKITPVTSYKIEDLKKMS